ncbi:ABC transporter permease [Caldisericum exile]|uniref:ABC transporter permease protein n=1 Tax=Caldisericum exile (strain DSM 21853 / NBRC 104410 / AZM16c01) TaxID=511051 RepID=A0A7U6GEU5_CALEA|nr:ABC transporter permease [Caldisericum exile]BAL81027.1 ABC transporter permease protein [Caldisericum exile AZM16c01]
MNLIISILQRTMVAGTPLLLGTVGEILAERSGILNLGIEGMMALGAIVGFSITYVTKNPVIGVVAGILAGGVLSLIHAFVSITIKGNQTLSGLAIAMIGSGLAGMLGKSYIGVALPSKFSEIAIPGLSNIPFIGPILFNRDPLFYIGIILAVFFWFLLFKTRWGINIRSVGENPKAADALGVNVGLIRYISTFIGGCFAGFAGAYLTLAYMPNWIEGMTGGRGWIVIALTIFAQWNPLRAILGAYIFGGVDVLQYILQPLGIPVPILKMTPYIVTIIILLITAREVIRKHLGAPNALGEPFVKGEK